jgi:two-component system response regulator NreC
MPDLTMMRVALVDDHPILRGGMRWLLEQGGTIQIVAEADSARAGLQVASSEIDVYVMDISLPDSDGFAATAELLRSVANAKVLILTMHAREELVVRAFQQGATGYALKEQPGPELVEAVHTVFRGERYVAPLLRTARLAKLLADGRGADGPLSLLSRREREVFDLLARGFSNKEMGARLFLSVKTIETHRTRIFRKLNVHSIGDLIRLAAREGSILER